MISNENVTLLREVYAAWSRGDFAIIYAFDPQVEYVRVGTGPADLDGAWRGIEELWTAVTEWLRAWELLTLEAEEFIAPGDRVLVLTRHTGRGKRSGIAVEHQLGDLFTFRAGKIVRFESYWDRAVALRVAGLKP